MSGKPTGTPHAITCISTRRTSAGGGKGADRGRFRCTPKDDVPTCLLVCNAKGTRSRALGNDAKLDHIYTAALCCNALIPCGLVCELRLEPPVTNANEDARAI